MGLPKALVRVDGELLWKRQVGILRGIGPSELMISAGHDWDPGPGPWSLLRDRTPGLGPLEGIGAALATASTELLLVLAIDMPSMSAAYLKSLIEMAGPAGVVPVLDGFYQGLAAVYPRAAASLVEAALVGEDHSMQHLVRQALLDGLLTEHNVSGADRHLFRNVNRPGDL